MNKTKRHVRSFSCEQEVASVWQQSQNQSLSHIFPRLKTHSKISSNNFHRIFVSVCVLVFISRGDQCDIEIFCAKNCIHCVIVGINNSRALFNFKFIWLLGQVFSSVTVLIQWQCEKLWCFYFEHRLHSLLQPK